MGIGFIFVLFFSWLLFVCIICYQKKLQQENLYNQAEIYDKMLKPQVAVSFLRPSSQPCTFCWEK